MLYVVDRVYKSQEHPDCGAMFIYCVL